MGNGEARRITLHRGRARFEEVHRVGAGKDAAGRESPDVEPLGFHPGLNLVGDGGQVVLRPVHAKAEVTTGQRAFDHDVVGQAAGAGALLRNSCSARSEDNDDARGCTSRNRG